MKENIFYLEFYSEGKYPSNVKANKDICREYLLATIKEILKSIKGSSLGRKHITDRNTEIHEGIQGTENYKYMGK